MAEATTNQSRLSTVIMRTLIIEAIPIPTVCLPVLAITLNTPSLLWQINFGALTLWGVILYPVIWVFAFPVAMKLARAGRRRAAMAVTALPPIALIPFISVIPFVLG